MLDLTNVDSGSKSYELLPKGDYNMVLEEIENKDTKDGTGAFFKAKFKVAEGPHRGAVVFHNFNYRNKSEMAQQIGLGQIKSFMQNSGFTEFKLENPLDLCGHSCGCAVDVRKGEGEYKDQNVIKYFKKAAASVNNQDVPF